MTASDPIDAAHLNLLLNDLRLPAIKHLWSAFTERADKEGWPAARLLSALAEHEIAERGQRRIERHLAKARLPPGKTLSGFDFDAVPTISKARVMALVAADNWLETGANLILFGPPGGGKTHLATAIGLGLIENAPLHENLARALHPNHRSGPETAGRSPRTHPRGSHRPPRQIPADHSR